MLTAIKRLSLSSTKLKDLTEDSLKTITETLEFLDLRYLSKEDWPVSFDKLTKLRTLSMTECDSSLLPNNLPKSVIDIEIENMEIQKIPAFDAEELIYLTLNNCSITTITTQISTQYSQLNELRILDNGHQTMKIEEHAFENMVKLNKVHLSGTQFEASQNTFTHLTALEKLIVDSDEFCSEVNKIKNICTTSTGENEI
ncbi:uncharacterized protein LOC131950934 [Physella acuta]|uniref:uncharacterized protein LOC131950934 n=1 Tax=Physella acuta TaxID=109671 RepID=UPI0027DC9DD2|nr:uncharacterized protein LOC131950934 [Physella acuta]